MNTLYNTHTTHTRTHTHTNSSPFSLQAHGSVELSAFCEGYFLQNMSALLEREGFRALLLGPQTGSRGGGSPRLESPLEQLEATLARRLRSLYTSSRV